MDYSRLKKHISLALCISILLLNLMPISGCGGGGGTGNTAYEGSSSLYETSGQSGNQARSKIIRSDRGFSMGVVNSQEGGEGFSTISIDVPSGAKLLKIGPSGAYDTDVQKGVTVTVYGADNQVKGTIIDGVADSSLLNSLPEPPASLSSASDKNSDSIAGNQEEALAKFEKTLTDALNSGNATSAVTQKDQDLYFTALENTPDAGKISTESNAFTSAKDESSQNSLTILNPTGGNWRIEVSAASSARAYDLVAMAVPSSGLPSDNEIGNIVSSIKTETGWQATAMYPGASDQSGYNSREFNQYWLYDTVFWLVKSVFKPSISSSVIAYLVVAVYPPAITKFSKIKSTIENVLQTVINSIGTSNYESFTEKVSAIVAKAICSVFSQAARFAFLERYPEILIFPIRTDKFLIV